MIVPLRAGGRVVGDLALVSAGSGRRYGAADLAAAQELADRCGLYLENARLYRELERAHDELEAILAGVADAVTVQGPDGRLTYVNDAAVRLLGEPLGFADRAALLAAPPAELAAGFDMLGEDGEPFPLERLPGRLALAGEEPEPVIVRYRVRATGETRWSRVKARPLRAPDGRVTQAINVIEDITDLKQAEETQRLLAEAGRVLAGSLDYAETLRRVAWLAVPALADWCTVDVVGDHGLERVAVAHANPAHAGLAARLQGLVIDPGGTVGPAAVAAHGPLRAASRTSTTAHYRAAALNPTHLEAMLEVGARSNASVPMTVRGERLGVMTLSTAESGRILGPEELAVLEDLGRRAAVAVDSRARAPSSARRSRARCRTRCCRRRCPRSRASRAAALYRAAGEGIDVGGDFYDLFSVADDEWIAVIGDVCGKGAEAAAVTALARYTIRTAAVRRRSPASILALAQRRDVPPGPGRALLHDRLRAPRHVAPGDPRRGRVRWASAGAAATRRTARSRRWARPGRCWGSCDDPQLEDEHAELRAGDALVLYTDGITEARAPGARAEPGGPARGAERDARRTPAQRIVEQLTALAMGKEGTPPRDDIAVLALRARGWRSPRRCRLACQARRLALAFGDVRPLEVADLFRLGLRALLGAGLLLLRLALALLLAALLPQRGVVGEVAGGLLDASTDLVCDSHAVAATHGMGGKRPPRHRERPQPLCSATVRSRSSARRISRETCIWETPTRSAISACVRSSTKRRCSTIRSRAGSAASVGAIVAPYSTSSKRPSSTPIDSAYVSPSPSSPKR